MVLKTGLDCIADIMAIYRTVRTQLARNSYSIGNGEIFSCISDAYRGAWDWPKHVDYKVRELYELGAECFELHRDFVISARRKLKC